MKRVARSEEEEDLLESAQAASDGESRDCLVAPANLPKHASGQPREMSREDGVETQVLIKNEAA
jgi:hypothetical protein